MLQFLFIIRLPKYSMMPQLFSENFHYTKTKSVRKVQNHFRTALTYLF